MAELRVLQPLARWLGRQRWLRFGIRNRLARLAEHPNRSRGRTFRQPFFGGTYVGNTSNYIDWSARYFGAYAMEELELFADAYHHGVGGGAVIDVGANVGNHSLCYALLGADVYSFEPNPAAMELFRLKVAANPTLSIHPFQMGLSDRTDRLSLSLPDHSNLGTASLEKTVGSSSVSVDVHCGDEMQQIQRLKHIIWIKIDVEGHDLFALAGLRQTIARHRPPVFFEWNGGGRFCEAKALFPEGYDFYRILSDRIFALLFSKPGYRLQVLPDDPDLGLTNVLAWPSERNPGCFRQGGCP
jgi:FkbM family methyltransferase